MKNASVNALSEEGYFNAIQLKTAALFSTCAELGALSVGASQERMAWAKSLGEHIGICFQIRDDIFDYYNDNVGKPTGNDLREGKITLPLVNALLKINGSQEFLAEIVGSQVNFDKLGYTVNSAVDALYKFKPANWTALAEQFPELSNLIAQTTSELDKMNYFLGLNISNSPMSAIIENFKTHNWLLLISALMIPVLAGLSQWINVKLMPQANDNSAADEENAMASSMKMMNNMMPLMSVFFCLSLPIGLGIYWIAGAVFRSIQQLIVNKHMEKMDVDELVRKNMEKVNEKRKKQGLPPKKISTHAKVNLKDIETEKAADEKREEKRKKSIQDSTEYYKNADVKPGSIAAKARMVQQFDDKKKKK